MGQLLVIVADVIGETLKLLRLYRDQPVGAQIIDLSQLHQCGLALGAQGAVVQIPHVVRVAHLVVVDGGAPARSELPSLLNPDQPARAILGIDLVPVFVVGADVLAIDFPHANVGVEPPTLPLMQQTPLANKPRRIGGVVVGGEVEINGLGVVEPAPGI